jgi:hypothetical protein
MKDIKTTLTGVGNTVATVALGISVLPYTIPADYLPYLPPKTKGYMFTLALIAKTVCGTWNALVQKDKTT